MTAHTIGLALHLTVAALCIGIGVIAFLRLRAIRRRWWLHHVIEPVGGLLHVALGLLLIAEIVLPLLLLPLAESWPRLADPPWVTLASTATLDPGTRPG